MLNPPLPTEATDSARQTAREDQTTRKQKKPPRQITTTTTTTFLGNLPDGHIDIYASSYLRELVSSSVEDSIEDSI